MSIREGKGQDLDGSDADGWDEDLSKQRKSRRKMEWRGTWLTRGEGEEREKYRVGKQQIEMGKVSNGMN